MPPKRKPEPPKKAPRYALPEARACAAIAREESLPGDRVRMTFRLVLARQDAEALAARAIREEKNLPALVEEILADAAVRGQGGP
jgi:hypothetical protein